MTLTKQQAFIALFSASLILAGCSTNTAITTPKPAKEKSAVPSSSDDTIGSKKIDLSTLSPITDTSSKEDIFAYAVALMSHGRYKDAQPLLLSLTQKHPELSGPHINLAICYFHSGKLEEAEARLNQALSLKPENPVIYDYLARIYRDNGKFEMARDNYLRAIDIAPDYAPAQRNLAILYDLYLGQTKDALTHYQHYQRLAATPDKYVAIWIRDLAKRTGTNLNTNTDNNKEEP